MTTDDERTVRGLGAKKAAAIQKVIWARSLQRQAAEMEREALREVAEVEVAEKVYRGLPRAEEDIQALRDKADPQRLWTEVRNRALAEMPGRADEDVLASKKQKDMIAHMAMQMLADGSWKTTEEMTAEMLKRGVPIAAANQTQRVSQVLSADPRFKAQRGRGWSLDVSPAQSDPEEAKLQNEWEENIRRAARRVVNADRDR